MTRLLLLGRGPLPSENPSQMGFPELRTESFLRALLDQPIELGLLTFGPPGAAPPSRFQGRPLRRWHLDDRAGAWSEPLRELHHSFQPDLLLSAGPFLPAMAAASVVQAEPLWIDVPGDPFAEAEARVAAYSELGLILPQDPTDAMALAWTAALARADSFSVASNPQSHALLGQLGLLGRLAAGQIQRRWAHVIPPTWGFGALPEGRPRSRAAGAPLVLALSGGFNTWLDSRALLDGLQGALAQGADLRLIVTGGAIRDLSEPLFLDFQERSRQGLLAGRVEFTGWQPHHRLPELLARAHALINVDRPGAEPLLGSRTRVLFSLHQGLDLVSTARAELLREIDAQGLLHRVEEGGAGSVTEALLKVHARATEPSRIEEARAWARERYAPERLLAPLRAWTLHADRSPLADPVYERLSREKQRAEELLSRTWSTPTWRFLSRVHGFLDRLGPPRR